MGTRVREGGFVCVVYANARPRSPVLPSRTKAILVNSPSNPTGVVLGAADLAALAGVGPLVISDEIYHDLVYGEREHTMLEFTDRAVVINGFSKAYAMTGWRLGYVILPQELVRPVQKLQKMAAAYDERRRFILRRLKEIGLGVRVEPTGAFYVLANAGHIHPDSYALAFDILERVGVATTPGIDFGQGAEGYLRFSYASSLAKIKEAMDRLEAYVRDPSMRPGR
ncbi:MAG: aminotransferase class I/II-fold pyridoxal phosphate-dependent enzyme [Bacillota bacterium]